MNLALHAATSASQWQDVPRSPNSERGLGMAWRPARFQKFQQFRGEALDGYCGYCNYRNYRTEKSLES